MTLQGVRVAIAPRIDRARPGQRLFEPSVRMVLPHCGRDVDDGSPLVSPELTSGAQIDYWATQMKSEIDKAAELAKRRLELASAETRAMHAAQATAQYQRGVAA